jgi:hypothetical protein
LFLLLAALVLLSGTNNPFSDPHTPALLAATHCITVYRHTLARLEQA